MTQIVYDEKSVDLSINLIGKQKPMDLSVVLTPKVKGGEGTE